MCCKCFEGRQDLDQTKEGMRSSHAPGLPLQQNEVDISIKLDTDNRR